MHDEPEDVLKVELAPREQLVWAGRPRLGIVLRRSDVSAIPFSLMFGAFAIFWETMAIWERKSPFLVVWGIPFLLIGLHLMFGRFFADAWQRERTYYGVTTERVLVVVVSSLFGRRVRSLPLHTLSDISLDEHRDGSGVITFGVPLSRRQARALGQDTRIVPTFELRERAREVYELIMSAQPEKRTS